MIQKVYRGWRSRREMVIKRRAIRLIQAHGKRWRPWRRFQRVKRAIALIQRVWRGYRVRRMVRLLQEQIRAENRRRQMATLNESLASMELAVSRISEREAVKIQRAWRRHAERGRRERALRAALTIQAHWRGTRAARARRLLAHEMASIVDAVVDAAAARGEEYFDRLHRSARVIQNYVRRVRRWKLEKDAATRIQEAARAFIERRRREKEENLRLLAEELFGRNLSEHFGSKSAAAARMRAVRGPFTTGSLAVHVYGGASSPPRSAEGAYAIVLPGRLAVFESSACARQIASVPLGAATQLAMDEGSLRSEDYHHKIKLTAPADADGGGGGGGDEDHRAVVVAFRSIREQNAWFKELMREKYDAAERCAAAGAEGGGAGRPGPPPEAQGWLTTHHDTRIFGVRFGGGILGFQSTSCTEVAVLIPIDEGVTTVTRAPGARWFALNNGEASDVLFADSAEDARMWMRTLPPSPTEAVAALGSPSSRLGPAASASASASRALYLEGFLSVYQSRGVATTTARTASGDGWVRMYGVMSFSHIVFYADARCRAPAVGEVLLHNLYVHPTDKRSLVDVDADGMEHGFRVNRPGVTQIMMAASTSAEAHAWIDAINTLGSEWVSSRRGRHSMGELKYWNEGEHYSKDGIAVDDDDAARAPPPRHRIELAAGAEGAPASPRPGGGGGWRGAVQSKLLHTSYWSSPEMREMRLRSLKQEVGLESMLRRT